MNYPASCLSSASFLIPDLLVGQSAWIEHAPFAFWLVEAHRPGLLVELGTHFGYSYLCFCQQVRRMNLPARCVAVDTWKGDSHAGFYGEQVLDDLRRYHDPRYSGFSHLLRATFDAALDQFAHRSIDLLHIDGRHGYEDARHDFETWRPKLSSRAIVLFHDTQVKEGGFGVFRLWEEVSREFPHFEFMHGHGLGVLGVGSELAADFPRFAAADDPEAATAVRDAYSKLGWALTNLVDLQSLPSLRAEVRASQARDRGGADRDAIAMVFAVRDPTRQSNEQVIRSRSRCLVTPNCNQAGRARTMSLR